MSSYFDFIQQRFNDFPKEEFKVENNALLFNELPLLDILKEHGTPLRLTYLPSIEKKIQEATNWFHQAFEQLNYQGNYTYCYCTKSSHFEFILNTVLKQSAQIETSSAFDIDIIKHLYTQEKIDKNTLIVANGFKRQAYTDKLNDLLENSFNCIPVLDNWNELDCYQVENEFQVGIRVATDEEPQYNFWTSRLGVRYSKVVELYEEKIKPHPHASLKLLHFFINTGIKDSGYYWNELNKFVTKYCELKKVCPTLDTIDIGGGLPFKNKLNFDFDYQGIIIEIINTIQKKCEEYNVPEPHIITEFGSFTVSESGATFFSVLDSKNQNDKEKWYMIDGSFINHLPDTWAIEQNFIMLAINNWNENYQRALLGGLTCDSMDYYQSENNNLQTFLPQIPQDSTQYLGFFHTGAYQEVLGGLGGLQHCLIPTPKHIVIDKKTNGELIVKEFCQEQKAERVLEILGYS
ncbi:MAG: arginine decarboxylase [Cytophagales bacterium]|nr:arginine decarboxylase [Cytophagales bacterium]